MIGVTPVPWDDVAATHWTLLASYVINEADLHAAGLDFSVVDDDGLEYEVAAFLLADGSLAMVGRGKGGPRMTWTVGIVRGQVSTAEAILAALGVSDWEGPVSP